MWLLKRNQNKARVDLKAPSIVHKILLMALKGKTKRQIR